MTPPTSSAASLAPATRPRAALVTLGCARNEVDSEELAARLDAGGFELVDDPAAASAVLVNTCGFVTTAKKDSVDTLLAAADLKGASGPRAVVAVGCLAQRYGSELADALPEADAVLGFDDYPDIASRLRSVLAGTPHVSHTPSDRRALLPITPLARLSAPVAVPGHRAAPPDLPPGLAPASGPPTVRRRLDSGPLAPLKLASGCDRRCTFCAIPSFRGSFVSRPPGEVLADARWLAAQGVRELFCVSENSTSYGKDLGDLRLLEALLPELAAVDGITRVRVSYLQPAEIRPGLIGAIATTPGVAAYFDLSFQHASAPVLRRMRRFGDAERFLDLLASVRALAPDAGIRSNVIVGFPGETEADVSVLTDFLAAAELDVVGVFGYSDEDGTAAAKLPGKLDEEEVAARVDGVSRLVDDLVDQRAAARHGEVVSVLVERRDGSWVEGRAAHQGPDVDGIVRLRDVSSDVEVGDLVPAVVCSHSGADLVADAVVAGARGAA